MTGHVGLPASVAFCAVAVECFGGAALILGLLGRIAALGIAVIMVSAILMVHGTQDPVIPLALAEISRKALVARGYRVEWHAYPMQHSVCPEEVEAIGAWLEARFVSPILR